MALTNCPECRKEMSSNASSCPNCGSPTATSPAPKKKRKKWPILLILIAVVGISVALSQGLPSDPKEETRLTLEKYNSIKNGMTYSEVVGIIGFEGTWEAELGEPGTALHTFSVRYMGADEIKGSLGANASFMFQGGKLNMKSQIGLS